MSDSTTAVNGRGVPAFYALDLAEDQWKPAGALTREDIARARIVLERQKMAAVLDIDHRLLMLDLIETGEIGPSGEAA